MTVHATIARILAAHGTNTAFGIMGDANMLYVIDFVRDQGGKFVSATHEGAAVSMADGYSRASGHTGVVTVTHGPALTNTVTALTEAARNGSRLLLITGRTPSVRGHLQSIDIPAVVRPTGAGYEALSGPEDACAAVERALARTDSEHRPIVLDVPFDFLALQTKDDGLLRTPPFRSAPLADASTIDEALAHLLAARRPLILAGRGAVQADASHVIAELAKLTGASLATTVLGKDMFRNIPGNIGICGTLSLPTAAREIAAADCILAIGASLNRFTAAALATGARIVQCDIDPAAFGAHTAVHLALWGDARATTQALVDRLAAAGVSRHRHHAAQLQAELAADLAGADFVDASDSATVDLRSAMIRLDAMLPTKRLIVTDTGRYMTAPWRYLHVDDPAHFIHCCNFGSIGLGLGTAIGASVAQPDISVVAVLGDAGFMMNIGEFSTAARLKLPLIVVIANDHAYGAEYRKLIEYDIEPSYSLCNWPDFVSVAESMGGRGLSVRSVDDVDALADIVSGLDNGPVLVNVMLNPAVDVG